MLVTFSDWKMSFDSWHEMQQATVGHQTDSFGNFGEQRYEHKPGVVQQNVEKRGLEAGLC